MTLATIKIGLSDEELAARRKAIGGSDANILMAGDPERIHQLWLEKTGRAAGPDLSDNLAVQLGNWTEELNCRWYERVTGRRVKHRNEHIHHATRYYMACSLDGATTTEDGVDAIWEAKWTNPFSPIEETAQRYVGQLTHNMACTGTTRAVLSVITGKPSYELFEMELDELYLCELLDREKAFWNCVERNEAPPHLEPVAAPPIAAIREIDMSRSNVWCAHAGIWIETLPHRKRHEEAARELKELIAADVRLAYGGGIKVSRSKAGALTIREERA